MAQIIGLRHSSISHQVCVFVTHGFALIFRPSKIMTILLLRSAIGQARVAAAWQHRSHIRSFGQASRKPSSDITMTAGQTEIQPLGERIKENTKTLSYVGVIAVGAAVTGVIFYTIFKELLGSNSPNNVYSAALEKCIDVSVLVCSIKTIYELT